MHPHRVQSVERQRRRAPRFEQGGDATANGVEFRRCHIARSRQTDWNNLLDAPRARRHHHDAIAEQDGFFDIVRDEYCGAPLRAPYRQQLLLHHGAGLRVKGGKRLVHQQYFWVVDENASQRHPLAHAAGKFLRVSLLKAGKPDRGDLAAHALLPLRSSHPALAQAELDVLLHREPGKQRVFLKDNPPVRAGSAHGLAIKPHLAAACSLKARDNVEERRLAATAGAEDGEKFIIADIEIDAVESDELLLAHDIDELLAQPAHDNPLTLLRKEGRKCRLTHNPRLQRRKRRPISRMSRSLRKPSAPTLSMAAMMISRRRK